MATVLEQVNMQPNNANQQLNTLNTQDRTVSTIASGAATVVRFVGYDNSANTVDNVYWKGYNSASPTVGTTDPDIVLPCPKNKKGSWVFSGGGLAGFANFSSVAVTEAGTGSAPGTNPTSTFNSNMERDTA